MAIISLDELLLGALCKFW